MYLKQIYLILIITAISIETHAQKALDTLYANEHQNVALFFPIPIQKAVTGHQGFVFTYNREKEGYFGLLQAVEGKTSNLLVMTSDGRVYTFLLQYAKELPQFNYFIGLEKSIGNAWPLPEKKAIEMKKATHDPELIKNCNLLLDQKHGILKTKRKNGIRLGLESMTYKDDKMYLVFAIQNSSTIDFAMNYLDILRKIGTNKRRTAYQGLSIEPIFRFKQPKTIKSGETKRFVYVLPKFVPISGEIVLFDLNESKGSRKTVLKYRIKRF
ncbi:DUF4138 domain-containing protein [Allomuricauda sp. F6463D]|uniref:DUF4138 domain-containing protein n=1 Tax=Allomuricauda sp. F6463D TaxID=2926409 RepID=UPI001FF1E4A9|nr:DUF4138 domain-containing protein [Muricauda sp. F6463D]MCK0162073.1 DUF4138 domain-containing protein [Muricauda sp. F6463D]